MSEQPARDHYLYINMRDVGCNCGERAPAAVGRTVEERRRERADWFADHLTRVASATPPDPR